MRTADHPSRHNPCRFSASQTPNSCRVALGRCHLPAFRRYHVARDMPAAIHGLSRVSPMRGRPRFTADWGRGAVRASLSDFARTTPDARAPLLRAPSPIGRIGMQRCARPTIARFAPHCSQRSIPLHVTIMRQLQDNFETQPGYSFFSRPRHVAISVVSRVCSSARRRRPVSRM